MQWISIKYAYSYHKYARNMQNNFCLQKFDTIGAYLKLDKSSTDIF